MSLSRNDVRLAVRSFARHRTFSIIAVLSLALAIALNTTMYGVIDALINPHTDIAHVEQLHYLTLFGDRRGKVDATTRASLIREASHTITAATSYSGGFRAVALEHGRRYEQGGVATVAPNIFRVLGIRPLSGRAFTDDDYTSSSGSIILGEDAVAALFAVGESPIGAVIDLDGSPNTVIGVIGRASQPPGARDAAWVLPAPSIALAALPANLVRLRAGLDVPHAEAELRMVSDRVAGLVGEATKEARYDLKPIKLPQFHLINFHYALIAAVIAVLLVACANLANLQLARGLGRSRELALRAALGATRRDIITQLLLESGILAGAGLLLGLILTAWGNGLLASHIPPSVGEYVVAPQTSWRVLAMAVAASVVSIMLIGLIPAIHVSKVDPNELLKSGAGTGANKRNRHKYSLMIVTEIGLSLALLSGAALVVRSAAVFKAVDFGFDYKPLTTGFLLNQVDPGKTVAYVDVFNQVLSRLATLPDAKLAAATMHRNMLAHGLTVADQGGDKRELPAPMFGYEVVSPSYLRTIGLPILEGRDFIDGTPSEGEVILDEPTARFLWPNGRALGGAIKLGSDTTRAPWLRVVGVVKERPRFNPLLSERPRPTESRGLGAIYYRPSARDSIPASKFGFGVSVIVRAGSDPGRMPLTLRHEFLDGVPFSVRLAQPMEAGLGLVRIRESHDFVAATFMLFTVLAVGLAALGIYGIVAHSVAERKREIGVRIALGATARDVLHAVLREGNPVALGGLALGLFCTKLTVKWLQAFSFEDDQYDAPLFAAMAAVLFIVAVASAIGPALRATRIDPVESLRSE
jgi:putative ABC transport system permease protein